MTIKDIQEEVIGSWSAMRKSWDKKGVHISNDELAQIEEALVLMSSFSAQTSQADAVSLIQKMQWLITSLTVEVKSEEHELQAETHGGQSFTEDELERINEYAYRCEIVHWLQHALEIIYETRPEYKPS